MSDRVVAAAPLGQVAAGRVRVWDPLVRVFHWSLVASFAVSWLSAEEFSDLHEVAGYVVAGLVAFRLVWGLIGSPYARFAQFVQGRAATLAYVRDMLRGRERRYLGHNPAGAVMIVALLVTLSGTALTGWLMADPDRTAMLPDLAQVVAPAFADSDGADEGESLLKEVHEVFANLLLLLVALHVVGVVFASVRHHENLARAMVSGDKRAPGPGDVV